MRKTCLYVPYLRGKQGEIRALKLLAPLIKDSILPLFDIAEPTSSNGKTKSFQEHVSVTLRKLADAWGTEREVLIDCETINLDLRLPDERHFLTFLDEVAQENCLKAILVCGLERDRAFIHAIRASVARNEGAMCIRLFKEDLELDEQELQQQLEKLVTDTGAVRSKCDLVLDMKAIATSRLADIESIVCKFLMNKDLVAQWKSLVLIASGFPYPLKVKPSERNKITEIPRLCYQFWKEICNKKVHRHPIFGDYGVVSPKFPEHAEFDRAKHLPFKVRYATNDNWLIAKGGTVRNEGYVHFRKLAKCVVGSVLFKGEVYSWGDRFINECASGRGTTGNFTTWVTIDMNHHITHVVTQLSS